MNRRRAAASITPLLRLTTHGIEVPGSSRAFARARATYEREHAVHLPRFLSPRLLAIVREQIAGGRFRRMVHKGFGSDQFLPRHNATAVLVFLMNDPQVFAAIRRITGCGPLRSVMASIRRAATGKGKSLSWHDDNSDNRRVAITINLSPRRYLGGLLQIRRKRDGQIVKEIANVGPGDGVLFGVSSKLEHRNTEVIGMNHKTAFSGWFRSAPQFEGCPARQLKRVVASRTRRLSARELTASTRIVIAKDVAIRHLGDGALLLNLQSGSVFRLDAVGRAMYELTLRRTTPRRIARSIAPRYEASLEAVEHDATLLLGDLAAHGLIEIIA